MADNAKSNETLKKVGNVLLNNAMYIIILLVVI